MLKLIIVSTVTVLVYILKISAHLDQCLLDNVNTLPMVLFFNTEEFK